MAVEEAPELSCISSLDPEYAWLFEAVDLPAEFKDWHIEIRPHGHNYSVYLCAFGLIQQASYMYPGDFEDARTMVSVHVAHELARWKATMQRQLNIHHIQGQLGLHG